MAHETDEQTNMLSVIDTCEEQDDIELGRIAKERMNDGQTPIRLTLDDL